MALTKSELIERIVAKQTLLTAKDVEVALPYRASLGYITFWPGTDPAVIQRWQRELDAMKADGSFSRIYQRWLPGEPEQSFPLFSGEFHLRSSTQHRASCN